MKPLRLPMKARIAGLIKRYIKTSNHKGVRTNPYGLQKLKLSLRKLSASRHRIEGQTEGPTGFG
jgi:hypothetical protein